MHITSHRSIKALQTQSMAYRAPPKAHHDNAGYQPALCRANWQPKTCQFIEGTPSRIEIRRKGSQAFMCGAAVKQDSSYCDHHHRICFRPLTENKEQAASDE
jgi:hypothetical protein